MRSCDSIKQWVASGGKGFKHMAGVERTAPKIRAREAGRLPILLLTEIANACVKVNPQGHVVIDLFIVGTMYTIVFFANNFCLD